METLHKVWISFLLFLEETMRKVCAVFVLIVVEDLQEV
jgi:hypothetical protein